MQEPCSTLAGVGHSGHRFSAFWPRYSSFLFQKYCSEAMDAEGEESLTQRSHEEIVLTAEDRTSDVPTYLQIVENETSQTSHMDDAARASLHCHQRV